MCVRLLDQKIGRHRKSDHVDPDSIWQMLYAWSFCQFVVQFSSRWLNVAWWNLGQWYRNTLDREMYIFKYLGQRSRSRSSTKSKMRFCHIFHSNWDIYMKPTPYCSLMKYLSDCDVILDVTSSEAGKNDVITWRLLSTFEFCWFYELIL